MEQLFCCHRFKVLCLILWLSSLHSLGSICKAGGIDTDYWYVCHPWTLCSRYMAYMCCVCMYRCVFICICMLEDAVHLCMWPLIPSPLHLAQPLETSRGAKRKHADGDVESDDEEGLAPPTNDLYRSRQQKRTNTTAPWLSPVDTPLLPFHIQRHQFISSWRYATLLCCSYVPPWTCLPLAFLHKLCLYC